MQGIELVLIFSLLSSFLSLFSALSSLLCPVLDSRNRILAFSQGNMKPRGRPPRRNATIRHDPGANTPCSELSWGSLSVPFCDILFFSLLASLAAATPGNVQTLMQNKLLLLSQIFLRVCLFDLFMRPSVSRQTVSFFGDTPILIEKVFFHRVVYTSISAQYPNQYANLAFPFSRITCCSTVAPSMARHTASSQGDTSFLIQTWLSHRNVSASNSSQ